jgi:hypothetical protein
MQKCDQQLLSSVETLMKYCEVFKARLIKNYKNTTYELLKLKQQYGSTGYAEQCCKKLTV